jgi:HSP20 family protein
MELVRWRPRRYAPVAPYDLDRVFDRMMRSWASPMSVSEFDWNPSIDVSESDDEIVVQAEIPGVSPEDVEISVDDNHLIISGEKRQESEEQEKNFYRVERSYGSFRRSLALPSGADVDNIKASSKDGVLSVRIPKGESKRSRKIEIESN